MANYIDQKFISIKDGDAFPTRNLVPGMLLMKYPSKAKFQFTPTLLLPHKWSSGWGGIAVGGSTDTVGNDSIVPDGGNNTTGALNFLYSIHFPVSIDNITLHPATPANGLIELGISFSLTEVSWTNQSGPTDVVIS